MARPVPSPNCPLTAVCKLTSGTRPRDARSLLRRDLAADGRGKLSHSEVQRFILSRRLSDLPVALWFFKFVVCLCVVLKPHYVALGLV
ncbi:MAG: hypothetical protein [Anelloviridae sp.]|nr:MAG: hypothetical protein [Anelloviridae sp.]